MKRGLKLIEMILIILYTCGEGLDGGLEHGATNINGNRGASIHHTAVIIHTCYTTMHCNVM